MPFYAGFILYCYLHQMSEQVIFWLFTIPKPTTIKFPTILIQV